MFTTNAFSALAIRTRRRSGAADPFATMRARSRSARRDEVAALGIPTTVPTHRARPVV